MTISAVFRFHITELTSSITGDPLKIKWVGGRGGGVKFQFAKKPRSEDVRGWGIGGKKGVYEVGSVAGWSREGCGCRAGGRVTVTKALAFSQL